MCLEIKNAEYLEGYKVKLWFSNGEIRVADLSESLNGLVFEPLRNIELFKRFSIPYNTIQWENGADLAPEYLHKISLPIE